MDANPQESPAPKSGGRQVHFVAVYDEDTATWSIDSEVLASDHVIYDMGRNDGNWELLTGNEDLYNEAAERLSALLDPAVYISPDGNWGDAGGLLLLSRSDAKRVGDLTELYEEYGDDIITAVRDRLGGPAAPKAQEGPGNESATRLAKMTYVYEIVAETPEDAEDQARSQFAEDLGSLDPRDFGCDVE